jgi:hypothetical protein
MSIEELLHAVPPPDQPLDVGTGSHWREVETSLGLRLPTDLYELCVRYGSGWFGNIHVHNPFTEDYRVAIEQVLDIFRVLKQDLGGDAVPYRLFPERPGLFPAGSEDNGGVIFFLTEGLPDDWSLLLWDKRTKWEHLAMSITTFVARTLKKDLECAWWDREWLEQCGPETEFRPRQGC